MLCKRIYAFSGTAETATLEAVLSVEYSVLVYNFSFFPERLAILVYDDLCLAKSPVLVRTN